MVYEMKTGKISQVLNMTNAKHIHWFDLSSKKIGGRK